MSLASESNNRLGVLVTLVGKIEGYMAADKKDKAKGKSDASGLGEEAEKIKGLAGSVLDLIKVIEKVSEKKAERFSKFMTKIGESLAEFSEQIKDVDTNKIKAIAAFSNSIKNYAIGMAAVALLAPLVALGTIVFALSVRTLINLLGEKSLNEDQQSTLKTISDLGSSILMYAVGMAAVAALFPLVALGTLVFIFSVSAIILTIVALTELSKGNKPTGDESGDDGIDANPFATIVSLGKAIAWYALGMVAIAILSPLVIVGTLVLSLSIMAIAFALKTMDGEKTTSAATSLKKLLIPLAVLAATFFLVGLGAKTIAIGALVMGLAIVGIGLAAYVLGKFDKDIKKGAGALDALAAPLILFSVALTILSRGVTDSAENLYMKLGAIAASIVGLGLAAYTLGIPAVFPFVLLGAVALTALAVPLIAFSGALFILSKVKFEPGQFDALGDNLKKLTTAFVDAFADLSLADMAAIAAGIVLTVGLAVAVATLAMGVQKMANLEVVDYEVKNGKIVPKSTRKLTEKDFENAGVNTGKILTTLIKPLTEFGKASREGTGEGFMSFFSDGYMEDGIELSGKVGSIITSLATGVANMANLNVVEYEVIGAGTKKARLVPKGVRKLTEADFELAGVGVGKILTALIKPLTDFGRAATEGEGLFSDGYLEKGIDAAAKVSQPLSAMVEAIKALAGGNVIEQEVVGTGKDRKVVPKTAKSFLEYIPKAKQGVIDLFHAFIDPLTEVGIYYDANEDAIDDGISAIEDIGDEIPKIITDMVNSIKSVSSTLTELNSADVGNALNSILVGLGTGLSTFAEPIEDLDADDIEEKLKPLLDQLLRITPANAQTLNTFNAAFGKFATNLSFTVSTVERIPKVLSPFERFVDKFGVFSKHIGVFVKNWKEWQTDSDKYWTNFSASVEKLSKVDAEKLKETAKIVADMAKEQLAIEVQRPDQDKGLLEKTADFVDKKLFGSEEPAKKAPAPAAPPTPPIDINTLTQAFTRALSTAVIIVKPDQTAVFRTRQ